MNDEGVTMTITLQPAIAVNVGTKLSITIIGLSLATVTTVQGISPTSNFISSFSKVMSSDSVSVIEFVFSTSVAANATLVFSLGTFKLPSDRVVPSSSSVEAAFADTSGTVVAVSSTGTFPGTFQSPMSGVSVSISSAVAHAPNVSVSLSFAPSSAAVKMMKLLGMTFASLTRTLGSRRLLEEGISCENLAYSSVSVSFNANDAEITVLFDDPGATRIDANNLSVCTISGFRNSKASASLPGVTVAVYDRSGNNFVGSAIQSGVIFPPILCEPGYSQVISGGSVDCLPCAKGTFNSIPGATQCARCPSGSFSDTLAAVSSSVCNLCPPATSTMQPAPTLYLLVCFVFLEQARHSKVRVPA